MFGGDVADHDGATLSTKEVGFDMRIYLSLLDTKLTTDSSNIDMSAATLFLPKGGTS